MPGLAATPHPIAVVLAVLFLLLSAQVRADCPIVYPNQYVAYELGPNEHIVIDGHLDEPAWQAVGWSADFMDIQGPSQPTPRFDTRMKMRWDSQFIYIGGYLIEPNVWANQTVHDSVVFYDNDFEFFCDPDGSTHHYKEFEINAIATTWDLMLAKTYIDGGSANNSWDMQGVMQVATYVDGPINDPNAGLDKYWTVELALPHSYYVQECFKARSPPQNGDLWRINFSRVEYYVQVVNGQYQKVPNGPQDNWVWQDQEAINMHLPERWGYLQFATGAVNQTQPIIDPEWPQRSALAQIYYSEHEYMAVVGYFTADLSQLTTLPSWVLDGSCQTTTPNISVVDPWMFSATVGSTDTELAVGNIENDRLMWFGAVPPPRF